LSVQFFKSRPKVCKYWISIRANTSGKSHTELYEVTESGRGIPLELGNVHMKRKESFSHLKVFGGCCVTDEEHVIEIVNHVNTSKNELDYFNHSRII